MIRSTRARVLALLTDTSCPDTPATEQIGRLLRPIEVDRVSGASDYPQVCGHDMEDGTTYDQKCRDNASSS